MNCFKYAKLILDEPRNIYYSGQVLNGHIECEVSQPVSYKAININFLGEADVLWTEAETQEYNGIRQDGYVKYMAHEIYFNTMMCVSGGMGVVNLPAGVHKVPFQFQIPHTAPSSFLSDKGSVCYKVIAYIEYPDASIERDQLERSFEVVAPLDLNIGDDIKQPIDVEFEEFYSCCCSSSPMNITIHIPASGFCPGQDIPINITAENESNVEVKKITFELIQKECYHSNQPTKSDYIPPAKVLETVVTGPILSNSKREIIYMLRVPDMIAPNLQNCNIIDIGYFLKVTIQLSGCNDDLEDESEICLGLIPLASLAQNYTHPMKSDLPQAAIPDPNFILAPPVQNMAYQTSAPMQNASAYPTASPYPNPQHTASPYPTHGGPLPNVSPYPPNQGIPMTNLRTGNIGFVGAPNTNSNNQPWANNPNFPGGNNPPYPMSNSPFPEANNAPYPGANNAPYPGPNNAPYPGANNAPYPGANNAPYPGANNAPYPGANNAPYPGANNAPYPGANIAPYPGANTAPYPMHQPGYQGYQPANSPSAPPS